LLLATAVVAGCSSGGKGSGPVVPTGAGTSIDGSALSGVVATGSAKQTVAADLAFVEVGVSGSGSTDSVPPISSIISGSNSGPIPIPTESPAATNADHKAIRAALAPLDLADDAVEFSATSNGGDGTSVVQVEVPVDKLPKIAHDVVAAIGRAGVKVSGQGLRFAVRDCAAALTSARTNAVADARANAKSLADAGGVSLGTLASVSEVAQSSSALSYFTGGNNPCGRGDIPEANATNVALSSLDAPARVDLTESVAASYALSAGTGRTVAATGQGESSGPADAAEIVVTPGSSVSLNGSTASNDIDVAAVVRAVRRFGVDKKDVEVENPPSLSFDGGFPQTSYVRVHVSIPQLTKSGHQIADAIQSTIGSSGVGGATVGVLFTASKCRDLLNHARAAAAKDARVRIDKLAAAEHVHAGDVTALSDATGIPYLPSLNPCELDVDDLSNVGLLIGGSSPYAGLPQLADLDAAPVVTERVSLHMSRLIRP
jgi:uncharacterized protein YggE